MFKNICFTRLFSIFKRKKKVLAQGGQKYFNDCYVYKNDNLFFKIKEIRPFCLNSLKKEEVNFFHYYSDGQKYSFYR